ncbi:MAG: hypothetical protein LH606_15420 [Cytophagaceae bacterium]|nr:hypothetical protein [Cytophagaceae bacterium]
MELPNADLATVTDEKITDYLLNAMHPQNKGKAAFYAQVGYSPANADTLRKTLVGLAKTGLVVETEPTPHGTKYVVVGPIVAPNGRSYELLSIWMTETNHRLGGDGGRAQG